MELERERGITIKAQAVRVEYTARDGKLYRLHLIDTPGHVDFTYEVSRSLAACDGALLLVDASQGVEAQTVANTYLAVDAGLELIPALNKIDLPGAEPERVAREIGELLGEDPDDVIRVSAKTGECVSELLEAVVRRIPPPEGDAAGEPRALIFDSEFDQYRGVVAYVRVVDGELRKGDQVVAMQTGTEAGIDEIGYFGPQMTPVDTLRAGEVGYIITGIKDVSLLRVGDTLTAKAQPGGGGAAGLPRGQADGVLRPLPGRHGPVPRAARRAREAGAERRRALVGAGDQPGARVRLPLRVPGPAPHGHRARAAGARVRPGAAGHHAQRRVRDHAHRRLRGAGALARRHARPGRRSRRSASPTSGPRSCPRRSTWAP